MDFFRTGNSKCQQYLLSFSLGLLLGIFLMVNINFNSISNNLKPVITTSVRTANNSRDQVKRRFPRALIIGSIFYPLTEIKYDHIFYVQLTYIVISNAQNDLGLKSRTFSLKVNKLPTFLKSLKCLNG